MKLKFTTHQKKYMTKGAQFWVQTLHENGKYRAYINIDGSFKSLGYFWDIEEANTAAKSARAEHFKEFARDE